MTETFEDARKLAITGGAIIMFLLLVGLSKIGVDTETLFYFLPMVWLAGIVLCGTLMKLCTLFDKFVAPPSSDSYLSRNTEWDADLATAEFNAFGVPRGNALLPMRSMRTNFLSSASSLPKYEELTHNAATTRIDMEPESNVNDSEHLLPPTYDEAVAKYSVVEKQDSSSKE